MKAESSEVTSSGSIIWPIFLWGAKVVGVLFVCAVGLVYTFQDKLLYIPNPPGFPKTPEDNPPGFTSPADWTKEGRVARRRPTTPSAPPPPHLPFEDKIVTTADGVDLHTWLLLQEDNQTRKHPVLIYFHGNAGNMGFRLKNAVEMYTKVKINILMMDYRGYGRSQGTPTEAGLKADGDAVLRYVAQHPKLQGCPIIVFGRSLGGAVSFYLAQKFPDLVSGIIVENTFLSISAMVDILMPYLKVLKTFLLKISWASEDFIHTLKQPMYFISGDSDTLVPPSQMKKLYDLATASSQKEFYSVLGGGHNDSWEVSGDEYYVRMKQFIDRYIRRVEGTVESLTESSVPSQVTKEDDQQPVGEEEKKQQDEVKETIAPAAVVEGNEVEGDYYLVEEETNGLGVTGTTGVIPTMNRNPLLN